MSSKQLKKRMNDVHVLVGNNVDEGSLFAPQSIVTEGDPVAWLQLEFPHITINDVSKALMYLISSASAGTTTVL